MKKTRLLFLFLLSFGFVHGQASKMTTDEYILKYKDIAISEMIRTGIPASIKLAQGVLESGSGNSELSLKSNNHFGIKCKSYWTGRKIYYDDDAKGECFRVYDKVEDSYRDHSDFLTSNVRYAFLFQYDKTDYEAWAKGLKQAGYATNPRYPELLIGIIEKYSLSQYDLIALGRELPIASNGENQGISINQTFVFNNIPAARVLPGDNMGSFGERFEMREWQVRKYNDLEKGQALVPGSILYLKPKRGRPSQEQHLVQPGETMHYISQLYAIRLKKLLRKNQMEEGQEPAVGERINLRKKLKVPPKLTNPDFIKDEKYVGIEKPVEEKTNEPAKKTEPVVSKEEKKPEKINQNPQAEKKEPAQILKKEPPKPEPITQGIPVVKNEPKDSVAAETVIPALNNEFDVLEPDIPKQNIESAVQPAVKPAPATVVETEPAPQPSVQPKNGTDTTAGMMHTVQQGETLYSISRQYNISVEKLRELNMLVGNDLKMGQQLKVKEPAPAPEPVYHVVAQGETLYAISRKYEVSIGTLMELNNLSGFDISVGQKLRIK